MEKCHYDMYSSMCPEIHFEACKKIINLGGNKNLVDSSGLTALTKFQKQIEARVTFWVQAVHWPT